MSRSWSLVGGSAPAGSESVAPHLAFCVCVCVHAPARSPSPSSSLFPTTAEMRSLSFRIRLLYLPCHYGPLAHWNLKSKYHGEYFITVTEKQLVRRGFELFKLIIILSPKWTSDLMIFKKNKQVLILKLKTKMFKSIPPHTPQALIL